MSQTSSVGHNIHIPTQGAGHDGVEWQLICFVRSVALIKKVGNSFGTLAFTWAIMLLRTFAMDLGSYDFWIVTAILSLEVTRLSSRSNRMILDNLQILSAILRVVLSLARLVRKDYNDTCDGGKHGACTPHLTPTLGLFYMMVLVQGAFYFVACVLKIFSFIPQRSLVHRGGFKGQWGVDSVNLYYAYALEKSMEGDIFGQKEIGLCNFAIDSLNSDSTKRQLHGIRIIHILLEKDATRTQLLEKLNASIETMTRLLRMLDWTSREDETIRLFAAKVINELAKGLLIDTLPGIVQNVSLLLDCGYQQKSRNIFLDSDDEQDQQQNDLTVNIKANQMVSADTALYTRNLLETRNWSTQQVGNSEHNFLIARWWRQVSEFWSIPQEDPLTEHDLLPVLGMSIIESLAAYDQSNCKEISKATRLIQNITRFTRFCTSDTKYTDAERIVLVHSSLKLLHRLTSVDGEIGITLRQKISNHPFLLRNLSDLLGDVSSCHDPRELVAGILRNLAVDAHMRQEIGRVKRIITRLMQHFSLQTDPPVQMVTGC